MSGVLHPVGPEPEQTYWRRRALVLGAALLMVVLVLVLVVNATSTGSAASSAPPPVVVPPAASPSASATPSLSASSSASASETPSATSTARASSTAKASSKATAGSKAKPAGPVACAPAQLRTTLTGKGRLKPKQPTTFALSVINGGDATCTVTITPATFSLTLYSGRDRIWSSADCATTVRPRTVKVKAEDAVEWSMRWNGRRSASSCRNRPEIPRAGTYVATAHLEGVDPVRLRVLLRG